MLSVFLLLRRRQPKSTLFPYTTLFRSEDQLHERVDTVEKPDRNRRSRKLTRIKWQQWQYDAKTEQVDDYNQKDSRKGGSDRKSTRLNSSHVAISYAVFCLKKKTQNTRP